MNPGQALGELLVREARSAVVVGRAKDDERLRAVASSPVTETSSHGIHRLILSPSARLRRQMMCCPSRCGPPYGTLRPNLPGLGWYPWPLTNFPVSPVPVMRRWPRQARRAPENAAARDASDRPHRE